MATRVETVRSCSGSWWATLLLILLGANLSGVLGQGGPGGPGGPPITEPTPATHGQWSGPWDLVAYMKNKPGGAGPYVPEVHEIAHSILVPPVSPEDVASSPFRGWVVFMNLRASGTSEDDEQPTWLWNPNDPGVIADEHHLLFPDDMTNNVFCSGHTYLADGRPVTAGGQDFANPSPPGPLGQNQSYVLDTAGVLDPGDVPQWSLLGTPTTVERWYPTVTTLGDGRLMQVGNAALTSTLEGVPCPTPGTHQCGDFYRSYFNPLLGDWGPDVVNRREGHGQPGCETATPMHISHYPRLHQLSSGELMWADGIESVGSPPAGDPQGDLVFEHASYFITVDPFAPPDCAAAPGNPFQWREGLPAPVDGFDASQKGAPTVHLLWPDPLGDPDGWAEVIYQFGGTTEPHDDGTICMPPPAENEAPTTRVARMVDPADDVPWDITGVEDMTHGRVNSNAVILLDGSILLVGGVDHLPGGACLPRRVPERFKPEEIFGGAPFDVHWRWQEMDEQLADRGYHSVAGLLPDGRVFSAGGRWDPLLEDDWHSVELYSPPYMFSLQPRPRILGSITSTQFHGALLDLDVRVLGGGQPSRFALVRPGSVTHGFDMSQRYIVLEHGEPVFEGGDLWSVTVTIPANASVAPPGWYLLTAIGGPAELPSIGKWVKIG